jgi:hypothetical protein
MKKLILAGVAAATLFTGGLVTMAPAQAAMRCVWNGPYQRCHWVPGGHAYYYHHPGWWYRGY